MRIAIIIAALVGAFAWGMAAGAYEIFPYQVVRGAKNLVDGDDGERVPDAYLDNPLAVEVGRSDPQWGTRANVVMIGDSLTAQARVEEMFPSASIVNRGVGGDTVQGVLDRLPGILEAQPQRAFVMVGINDIFFKNPENKIVARYDRVLAALDKAGVETTVQAVIECGDAPVCTPDRREAVRSLNGELRALAARHELPFVDLNAELSGEDGLKPQYTWDGIHLNAEGNRVWRDTIAPMMQDDAA